MDNTMYIVNGIILLTIVRQVIGAKLNLPNLLLPVVTVGASAVYFLPAVPTAGNDLVLILGLAGAGVALGLLGGLALRLDATKGPAVIAKAGLVAAMLMVVGSGARMAFAYAGDHGFSKQIGEFSRDHMIMGQDAWVAALVLMALSEVVTRVVVTRVRGHLLQKSLAAVSGSSAATAPLSVV